MEGGKAMSTTTRPELSIKNPYWIERHRYYELKHFCLQYNLWKKELLQLDGYPRRSDISINSSATGKESDPTYEAMVSREQYIKWMNIVEKSAKETSFDLGSYVLKGVTEGMSYDILRLKTSVPCCKEVYYDLYRRFFWLLSKERQ